MAVTTNKFGITRDGRPVTAYCLKNAGGASVTVLDYGATVQSLIVPNSAGGMTDVVLGYDTVREYEENDGYVGATIGRVGNRIGGAAFRLNGHTYSLAKNDGENHLHGGILGFDKQFWTILPQGDDALVCSRLSPDGEEGYPGNLQVKVTFTLTPQNALRIQYDADTDRDTLVNLTNHSYFNLNGRAASWTMSCGCLPAASRKTTRPACPPGGCWTWTVPHSISAMGKKSARTSAPTTFNCTTEPDMITTLCSPGGRQPS